MVDPNEIASAANNISLEKTPTNYSWLTYLWVIGLSSLGGVVSFVRKVRAGESRPYNIMEFFGEIVTSAFVGIITFYLCEHANMDQLMTAVLVGISGHMGTRAIYIFEKMLSERLGARRARKE